MARTAGYIVLFSLIPIHSANSAFIPLLGGLIVYNESASIEGGGDLFDFATGTSQFLAENIQVAFGGATASASNTAGSGQTPALSQVSANVNELGLGASANADITFRARLIKLHPDAPDDIGIPLLYTSSLSATDFGLAQLVIGAGGTVVQEQVNDGSIVIDSSLSVLSNDFLTIEISASASAGGITNEVSNASASASTPVFAIDPDFTVEFLGRTERAVDLYTLAVTPEIGYAGDFQTVTPFTDGCLPDPSILTTSGAPSVTNGSRVTCQAIDPSGFRSYGNDPGDLSGVLNGLEVVVTPGATVETNADDTETFGILGQDNVLLNQGTVRSAGENSEAVFLGGDGNGVVNQGDISSSGDTSTAVFLEGDLAGVLNEGAITTSGFRSSAVVIEGDGGQVVNDGEIHTSADQSSGIVFEGAFGLIENSGTIGTQGVFSTGIAALGISSIENSGLIVTNGDDAMAILALGPGHEIRNLGSGVSNQIWTTGDRAHGIALGLQDPVLPPGVVIPLPLLDPATGSITSSGSITTEGMGADAIHAFANDLELTNSGELSTLGQEAHGISVVGNRAIVVNTGEVNTSGIDADGIVVDGSDAVINHGDASNSGTIITTNSDADGIYVVGNNAEVNISGGANTSTILTEGDGADGIHTTGPGANIDTAGNITVQGNFAAAIDVSGNEASVENLGIITSGLGQQSSGNDGIYIFGSDGTVTNNGVISITSSGGAGVFVTGNDVVIHNGGTGVASAGITATGGQNIGIAVDGSNPQVSNEAPITVGDGLMPVLRGIEVTAAGGSSFLVENSSTIEVIGNNGFGMVVQGAGAQSPPDASFTQGACVSSPGGRNLSNCGTIQLAGSDLTGMLLEGTSDSFVENQIRIIGSGVNVRGMVVQGAGASVSTDNLVTNFDEILLDGTNATGILVRSSLNTVLSGSGATEFPDGILIDSFLDFVTSDDDDGTGPRTGNITVTGDNAAGIVIDGSNNRVGIRAYGQVVANGTNAVGVMLSGNDNLLVNDGVLVGTGAAVQGSSGVETVLNDGVINGNVNLMGGEDTMIITDATVQLGVVDGGDNVDTLRVVVPRPSVADPVSFTSRVDGSEYINFEEVIKEGDGTLSLVGDLMTWNTSIKEGQFSVEDGVLLETVTATIEGTGVLAVQAGATVIAGGEIVLNEFGTLGILPGGSVIATDIQVNSGSTLFGEGSVIGNVSVHGGLILPGTSPGELTIEGDLLMEDGLLVLEADSLFEKDTLVVEGDAIFSGGYIDVILGFTPEPDDLLEFLILGGTLNITEDFGGIRGIAAANSGVALGTEFLVDLGGQSFQGTITSVVPVPPAVWLFGSGLLGLVGIARRKKATG
jgi:hypothetical protein